MIASMKKILATFSVIGLLAPLLALPAFANEVAPICSELPSNRTTISNTTQVLDAPLINIETQISINPLTTNAFITGVSGIVDNVEPPPTAHLTRVGEDFQKQLINNSPTVWGNHLIELTNAAMAEANDGTLVANFNWQVLPSEDLAEKPEEQHSISYTIHYLIGDESCQITSKMSFFNKDGVGSFQSTTDEDDENTDINSNDNNSGSNSSSSGGSSSNSGNNNDDRGSGGSVSPSEEVTFLGQVVGCEYDEGLLDQIPSDLSNDMDRAVRSAIQSCILLGNDDGQLELFKPLTRAEMVALTNRITEYEQLDDLTAIAVLSQFGDYRGNDASSLAELPLYFPWQLTDWFGLDLAATVNAGLFTGYPIEAFNTEKEVFLPGRAVLRTEAVKSIHDIGLIMETLICKEDERSFHQFSDVEYNALNDWYTEKLGCMYDQNIVKGENEAGINFSPTREVTKGEFIKMLMFALGAVD